MDMSDLILAGIAVAQRWPEIDLTRVKIGTVPKGTTEWKVVLYTPESTEIRYFEDGPASTMPQFHYEIIQLEQLRVMSGEIRIGYGPQSEQLRFWVP